MKRKEAVWAVISGGIAKGLYLLAAISADKSAVIFGKSLIFEITAHIAPQIFFQQWTVTRLTAPSRSKICFAVSLGNGSVGSISVFPSEYVMQMPLIPSFE